MQPCGNKRRLQDLTIKPDEAEGAKKEGCPSRALLVQLGELWVRTRTRAATREQLTVTPRAHLEPAATSRHIDSASSAVKGHPALEPWPENLHHPLEHTGTDAGIEPRQRGFHLRHERGLPLTFGGPLFF